MAQKEHLLFKLVVAGSYIILTMCLACSNLKEETISRALSEVDTSHIPTDTISVTHSDLVLTNGIYQYNDLAFSGFIQEDYSDKSMKSVGSYYKGMQHGETKTFYPNGKLRFSRMYKENVAYGKHIGLWENGNMKFNFLYVNDKREGLQKQWYENGRPYAFLNFKDDRENGMQQAWRENGKPYLNYEAKDGFRYGLQKSALCYTLKEEQVQ